MKEHHALVWRGLDAWRAEYADVVLGADRLLARGTQIGVEPLPYRLSYSLDTAAGFITTRLTVDAVGSGWSRRLDLSRDPDGVWRLSADGSGTADLPHPGGDPERFAEALDCDIAHCPLTNTMPVLRERLMEGGEPKDFVMAWVSVPDLTVRRSEQRYEPVDGSTVRYVARDGDFVAELDLDGSGLVVRYPDLAERVRG
jgi:hypothetical protein